jgi:hypothetical protein
MSNTITRGDIPLGYTHDALGNELSFKDSDGYWRKKAYDAHNNELSFEDSSGYWRKCTRDAAGNELSYENSSKNWRKRTRDAAGNELSYEDKDGVWLTLAHSLYTLRFSNGVYWAGCHRFTRDKALEHWGGRLNHKYASVVARATRFIKTINTHESNDLQTTEKDF